MWAMTQLPVREPEIELPVPSPWKARRRYYGEWLRFSVSGFRRGFEAVAFAFGLVLVGWGQWGKVILAWLGRAVPLALDPYAFRVPFWLGIGVVFARFLWFPLRQKESDTRAFEGQREILRSEIGRLRELLDTTQPDVTMNFAWEKYADGYTDDGFAPPPFRVESKRSTATDVEIGPITGGGYAAVFPLVPELGNIPVELRCQIEREADAETALWRAILGPTQTIETLLRSLDRQREQARLEPLRHNERPLTREEHDQIAAELARPIDIEFSISYWNWEKTRRWRRAEILRYFPDDHRAYIQHGKRVEIT